MMLLPLISIGRQPLPVRQHILAGLRSVAKSIRLLDNTTPRMRFRSLDVLAFSCGLPRHTSIKDLTHNIDPLSDLSVWNSLESGSSFVTALFDKLIPFFAKNSTKSPPSIPPLMTWNPSSLATVHTHESQKLKHILTLAKSHICFLQETNWSTQQFNYVHSGTPFCQLHHSPATGHGSSGVATFLPKTIQFVSSLTITPGFIFSVSIELQGFACELVNVYLHPNKVSILSQSLLGHLRSPHSRKHTIRIVGGDFNRLQQRIPQVFSQITTELNAPPHHSYQPTGNIMGIRARSISSSFNLTQLFLQSLAPLRPLLFGPLITIQDMESILPPLVWSRNGMKSG